MISALGLQPNDLTQATQRMGIEMTGEQIRNRLTKRVSDCTNTLAMGRPPKPEHLRRSERFFLRLTPSELAELERASRKLGEPVAAILRKGGLLYSRGKDGSRTKGEKRK
jgi:hypothetical protein